MRLAVDLLFSLLLAVATVGFGLDLYRRLPPAFEQLAYSPAVLTESPASGRYLRTHYFSRVPTSVGPDRLPDECLFLECALPQRISELRTGDPVVIWHAGGVIWQLNRNDVSLYSFAEARNARAWALAQSSLFFAALALVALPLLWRWLRRNAA